MSDVKKLQDQLAASLTREENLKRELDEIRETLEGMRVNSVPASRPVPSAPTEDEINEELSKISTSRHKEIRELLSEIREFDGTTDVEAFLAQCKRINKQMKSDAEKICLINKIIALKLKGEAIFVADRLLIIGPTEFAEAMRLAFGKTERDYSQLIEERNSMRQGYSERIENFIKRYADIDKKIQRSIDQVSLEFREVTRRMEERDRISRFLRALRPEIKTVVMTRSPEYLNVAYQYAMAEEKIYNEDESLRSRQKSKREDLNKQTREQANKSFSDTRTVSKPLTGPFCNFCKRKGHIESKCFKKNPELQNFQQVGYSNKDPPKRIHETQESYIMPPPTEQSDPFDSTERIQYCSQDLSVRLRQTDFW